MNFFFNTCDYSRDCLKVPIPDKCVNFCLERILRNATVEEKQLILGLDAAFAKAIFDAYNSHNIDSFDDLKAHLTSQQKTTLIEKFKSINQFQLNYFNRTRQERAHIINEIKNLGLDNDMPAYA